MYIQRIYALFIGLTGVGGPNQKVFLDFYSLCPISVSL